VYQVLFPWGQSGWGVKLTTHLQLVKNAWSYNSTPQYASMAWCSVKRKHRDIFTLPIHFCGQFNLIRCHFTGIFLLGSIPGSIIWNKIIGTENNKYSRTVFSVQFLVFLSVSASISAW
jgi:hypothetical protein